MPMNDTTKQVLGAIGELTEVIVKKKEEGKQITVFDALPILLRHLSGNIKGVTISGSRKTKRKKARAVGKRATPKRRTTKVRPPH